jgi:beta-galactosidase
MLLRFKYVVVLVGILILSNIRGHSQLYVGANYHPHDDKTPEKIKKDIQLMKEARIYFTCSPDVSFVIFEPPLFLIHIDCALAFVISVASNFLN